ncbi:hypothetical protein KR032_002916, partial [Drosophila birchii]
YRNVGAFVSLMSCVIGMGILALPLGFYFAGIINGIFMLTVSTILLVHGMHLLVSLVWRIKKNPIQTLFNNFPVQLRSMVECSRRMQVGYATYKETVTYSFMQGPGCLRCWAQAGGHFVNLMLCCSHYGICVAYVVFVSVGYKHILDQYIMALDLRIYVAIVGLLIIPLFLIRKLGNLVTINMLSNTMAYFGFIFMFYFLFIGLPPITERRYIFGDVKKMALFLGIVLFSISSVGMILVIESMMETPQDYVACCGMLNMSFAVVLVSYAIFGVFGYWRFGDKVAGAISLNLPTKQAVATVSSFLIVSGVMLTYPSSGYVVIDIIMNHYWNKDGKLKNLKRKEILLRIAFVILTTANALLPLNLFPLVSLIGASSISLLNLIFPALIEICLYYPPEYREGRPKWKLLKNIFIIFVGIVIFILGTYIAITETMETWGRSNV